MQFLLVLLLLLAVQAQAVNLSFGDQLDPYDADVGFFTSGGTAGSDTGFITGIQSNLTVSVAGGFGSSSVIASQTGGGGYSFSFTPNTGAGSANLTMEYSFNAGSEETLNFTGGVNFLQFDYNLDNDGPLDLTATFDGTANTYNLANGVNTFFIPITDTSLSSNFTLGFSLTGTNANLTITSPITAVPEPATIAGLFVLAAFLFFAYRRRQQAQQPVNAAAFAA